MFWRWHNKLKWAPCKFFAPSPLLRVRSWLHPFKGHCDQKATRDEGVIYVAGHPLLNRRCTRLPGCFHSQKRNIFNYLTDINLLTKLQLLKAWYSLIVLKVPLNSNQSINLCRSCEKAVMTGKDVERWRSLSMLFCLLPEGLSWLKTSDKIKDGCHERNFYI